MIPSALRALLLAVTGFAGLFGLHRWAERTLPPPRFDIVRQSDPSSGPVLRVGYFPALHHAQALIGIPRGDFQRALGSTARIEPYVFRAGPEVVEAMFAGAIDLAYVGPNPAINAHLRSRGTAVRVLAGSCSGGAALVVRAAAGITKAADLRGRMVATPLLGNTQDISARAWLLDQGLRHNRDVQVVPFKGADQLSLFQQGELDAAWTTEPWVSRLVHEANGRILLEEGSLWPQGRYPSTLILVSERFLRERPAQVRTWLKMHVEITRWIATHPVETKALANAELALKAGKPLPAKVMDDAFARLEFTWEPLSATLAESARRAYDLGFLGRERPDLSTLVDETLLRDVLRQGGF